MADNFSERRVDGNVDQSISEITDVAGGLDDEMPKAPQGPSQAPNAGAFGASNSADGFAQATGNFNGGNFNGAPGTSFFDDLSIWDVPSGISDAGRQFLTDLNANLSDPVKSNQNAAWTGGIKMIQLSVPNDTHAAICNNCAVILIMSESNEDNSDLPVIRNEGIAAEALRSIRPEVDILKVVVITPEDYSKVAVIAAAIRNVFLYKVNTKRTTISSLCSNVMLSFSDNPAEFDSAYKTLSPHGVPLRKDFTMTIYAQNKAANGQNWNNNTLMQDESSIYLNRANVATRKPIGVISGYMEFVRGTVVGGITRYIPILHISEIHSHVIADELIPVYIVAFTKRLAISGLWKSYFLNHTQDVHKNPVDIGWLLPDGNGGRCKISDVNNFNKFLADYCEPVQVVLDMVEGRFSIPGMWKFASTDVNVVNEVLNNTVQFLEGRVPGYQSNIPPFQTSDVQYRGTYRFGDKVLDTAYIDFMNEYPRHPTEAIRCEKLLLRKVNAALAAADQREFEPDMKLLYRTEVIAFNPEYIRWLDINMPFLNAAYVQQQTGYAPVDPLIANAQKWSQYTSTPTGGNYGMGGFFNPGDFIYRR